MSVESTREVIMDYLDGHGATRIGEHAVYTVLGSGQEAHGREAITQFIHDFYTGVFDSTPETRNLIVGDGQAVWEGWVVGKHVGDVGDIPASGRDVRVPICVCYDIENGYIERARVYLETDVLRQPAASE